MATVAIQSLPNLRSELDIIDGGHDKFGAPTWVIHDPLKEKFFRIGWQEFEIISHWYLGNPDDICKMVNATTTTKINTVNIEKILEFLKLNELLEIDKSSADDYLYQVYSDSKKHIIQKALQKYLFLQVPLFKPDKALRNLLRYVKILFTTKTLYVLFFILVMGLYLIMRQWGEFIGQFNYLFTPQNMFILSVAVLVTKFFHELGHAFVAKYYGCKIPTMGIALLVFWPVFYTDTTDTWRLKSRHHRVLVASAGIIAETGVAIIALFLWGLIDDGVLRSILIYIPTVSIVSTILINANPLLRYDGYHIISEILATDNLQTKAYNLATWYFRKQLFGIKGAQPVPCSKSDLRLYLFYAYFSWVYRISLYLSVATIVYFYFFKILGVVLMIAEVYLFILNPAYKEAIVCAALLKKTEHLPTRALVTISIFVFGVVLLFVPLQNRIEIPAILAYEKEVKVYTLNPGLLKKLYIKQGDLVKKDAILAEFTSDEIDYQVNKSTVELNIIKNKLREQSGMGRVLGEKQASAQELMDKESELAGALAEKAKLTIAAPYYGQITDISKYLKVNTWHDQNNYLFTVSDPETLSITGYMDEHDVARLNADIAKINGQFYFERMRFAPIQVQLIRFNKAGSKYLDTKYLASLYGGELTTFLNKNAETKRTKEVENLILHDAVYQVIAKPSHVSVKDLPNFAVKGTLYLYGEKVSIMSRFWRRAIAIMLRESGF